MKVINASIEVLDELNGKEILERIEKVARTCYRSEAHIKDGSAEKLVSVLVKNKHEAMLEHVSIAVKVICDRGVTHEIVRHRIASYAQESTRYVNYSKDTFGNEIVVIDPSTAFKWDMTNPDDETKYLLWHRIMEESEKFYMKMIELGCSPQEARSVLPNSTKTEIVMTLNLRSWRNFLNLRTAKDAHPQIREIADMILEEFRKNIPIIFDNINN